MITGRIFLIDFIIENSKWKILTGTQTGEFKVFLQIKFFWKISLKSRKNKNLIFLYLISDLTMLLFYNVIMFVIIY